jgi:uncharacterized repeat protein (TIGR03803 family)
VNSTMQGPFSNPRIRAACATLTLVGALVLVAPTATAAYTRTFTTLYNFTYSTDGGAPLAGVVQDAAGNLYGTAVGGGDLHCNGVVFKVDRAGKETVLHRFRGGTDGEAPNGGVVRDKVGNLYGTTTYGGSSSNGVVFKVDTNGKETVLYSFAGGATDGCNPYGGLIQDKYGNLYGNTSACGASGYGTVFKLSQRGKETVLHSFGGGATDGKHPYYSTTPIMDRLGILYGVTEEGGATDQGVVYKLEENGRLTLLHSFAGGMKDGRLPFGMPAMDKSGSLYGTTYFGGPADYGTVWKVSQKGTETILHAFAGKDQDYADPNSGVVLDSKGNLYGDTYEAGGYGTVYELSKSGKLTVLHIFSDTDGAFPWGALLRDAKGGLYGTTAMGGSYNAGTVWSFK